MPFVKAVFRFIDGHESLEEAVNLLTNAEQKYAIVYRDRDSQNAPEFFVSDQYLRDVLYPFWDETHLIISADDLLPFVEIWNAQNKEVSMTWREYGGYLADWANKTYPQTSSSSEWTYIDFYSDSYRVSQFERYSEWKDALRKIITHKSAIQK